eukprot:4033576-Amphidinium_carterae.1
MASCAVPFFRRCEALLSRSSVAIRALDICGRAFRTNGHGSCGRVFHFDSIVFIVCSDAGAMP